MYLRESSWGVSSSRVWDWERDRGSGVFGGGSLAGVGVGGFGGSTGGGGGA